MARKRFTVFVAHSVFIRRDIVAYRYVINMRFSQLSQTCDVVAVHLAGLEKN